MKPIPKWPKYSINEDGTKIYNNKTKRWLKLNKQTYIYASILSDVGEYINKPKGVHRLVAWTYLPPPDDPNKVWVNHIDGNKHNNHYSNLEWTTISQNIQHAYDTGLKRIISGKDHWRHGIDVGKVTRNRMSKKKMGENHPKFKGWYCYRGQTFASANEAARITKIDKRNLTKWAMKGFKGWTFKPKDIPIVITQANESTFPFGA